MIQNSPTFVVFECPKYQYPVRILLENISPWEDLDYPVWTEEGEDRVESLFAAIGEGLRQRDADEKKAEAA